VGLDEPGLEIDGVHGEIPWKWWKNHGNIWENPLDMEVYSWEHHP